MKILKWLNGGLLFLALVLMSVPVMAATNTITASADVNGSISPNGSVTVNSGDTQGFTITPATGYMVNDVLVDGSSVGAVTNYQFANVTADHTISATFAINTYKLTASATAGGSISPSGVTTVNYGGSQSYTITPNTGYHIADVVVAGSSVCAVTSYTFTNVTGMAKLLGTIPTGKTVDLKGSNASGTPSIADCPAGTVAVGYGGRRGAWMDEFQLICKQLNDDGTLGTTLYYTAFNGSSGGGGPDGPYILPADMVMVGATIDSYSGYVSGIVGHGKPVASVVATSDNSSGSTVLPRMGGYIDSTIGTVFSPNGTVITGMYAYSNGYSTGVSFRYTPVTYAISATFAINTNTVTPSAGAGGSISPSIPQAVNFGSKTSFTVTAYPGYSAAVSGTCGGALDGATYTTNAITVDCTVEASFIPLPKIPRFAYAANHISNDVSVYTIDQITGALIAGTTVAAGSGPMSVNIEPAGKFAYVLNWSSDNISVYAINQANGALSVVGTPVVAGGDAYKLTIDPSGKFVYVTNGSVNAVSVFTINQTTGALTAAGSAATGGAWAIPVTVDPSGKFAYVGNYSSNTVSVYTINQSTGALTAVGTPVAAGTNPGSIAVDPSGRFVYVTNNGSNTVSIYTIDLTTGALTPVGTPVATGSGPSTVIIDPSGKFAYVSNYSANTVSVYTINQSTGAMTAVGTPVPAGTNPQQVTVDPSGKYVYVANSGSNNISVFSINQATGALTAGNVVPSGSGTLSVTTTGSIQQTTYNATTDFSSTINPNGVWSYGWMPVGFGPLNLYASTNGVNTWLGNIGGDGTPVVGKNTGTGSTYGIPPGWLTLHPGPGTQPSVLRFTAPYSGNIRITGQFLPGDSGIMLVAVRVNGQQQWQAGDSGAFDLSPAINAGDTVDFTVYGGYGYGSTPIDATITYSFPIATLTPASFDFGNVPVGGSASSLFTITNTGTSPLIISAITPPTTDYSVSGATGGATCGTVTPTIAAGSSCTVNVTFTPTSGTSINGSLTITSNAPTAAAALTGSGILASQTIGAISFAPTTLAVGGMTTASAIATSGLAVSFGSKTSGICSVNGSTVTGTAAGTCIVAADQAGGAAAASQVTSWGTLDPACTSEGAPCAADAAFTPSTGGYRAGGSVSWPFTFDPTAFTSISSIKMNVLVVGFLYQGNINAGTGQIGNYLAIDGVPFAPFLGVTDHRDTITFDLPANLSAGPHTFSVVAYSNEGWGGVDIATLTVTGNADYGAAPQVTQSITVGKGTPSVTTWPTAGSITYGQTLASSTLSGGSATPAGIFAFTTPGSAPSAGTAFQSVTFIPTDTANYTTLTGMVSVTVNPAISITTTTLPSWTVNQTGYSQTITATGGSGGVSFAVTAGIIPIGMNFTSGVLSGTPTVNGTFTFTITATDSLGSFVSQNYSVSIDTPCVSAPTGLVGWWKGEGNANDQTGLNDGTLVNGASFTTSSGGKDGQAFNLNGTDQYVSIPNSPSLQPLNLTIQAWLKLNYFPVSGVVVIGKTLGNAYDNSYAIWYESGSIFGTVADTGGMGTYISYPFVPTLNTWYHIAYTFDDIAKIQSLYINGQLVASGTQVKSISYDTHPVLIGADINNSIASVFFPGAIDEVQIYNQALTAREIQATYNAGANGTCGTLSPTISGTPTTTATVGTLYSFTPSATNAASFSYTGSLPPGLNFDATTGTLSGTPTSAGTFSNIVITVINNTVTASLPAFPITVTAISPGAPTSVTATAGNSQDSVSFMPPTTDGGSPITSYTVTASPGNITTTGPSSPITVTGLSNSTAYTFTVSATNAAGLTGPAASAAINLYGLSVTITGTGSGSVNSSPSGINCTSGTCAHNFISRSTVNLIQSASNGSQFYNWGAYCKGPGIFGIFLTSLYQSVTITFNSIPNAQIIGSQKLYGLLQLAYNDAVTGADVQAKATTFVENLTMDTFKAFTLKGGYDSIFATQTGYTVLQGILTVGQGILVVDQLTIE